jgi:hypothetical protein
MPSWDEGVNPQPTPLGQYGEVSRHLGDRSERDSVYDPRNPQKEHSPLSGCRLCFVVARRDLT